MFGRSVPQERPERPFVGFKLAQPVWSADGGQAGFTGLSIGARRVYGVAAEAACVWSRRHAPPVRRCGCGFYCLNTLTEARALSCATENRDTVLLEVVASGRFIRFERGLRYSTQRVRAVRVGRCGCGRPAALLAGNGRGFVGWRRLTAACLACAAGRWSMEFGDFAASLGGQARVGADGTGTDPPGGTSPVPRSGAGAQPPPEASIAVLTAEIALVQARLDDLQARIARHYGDGDGR